MSMRKLSKSYSIEKICSFTRAIVWMDIAINLSAGFVLLFDPPLANRLLFNAVVLPGWLYRLLGVGFLLFAAWQILVFVQPGGFRVRNLRFAAVLAWVPAIALSYGLLSSVGGQLLPAARIFLWAANGYMVLLGGLYWGLAEKYH